MSLVFERVSYRYAGALSQALSSVDLAVEPGRVLGLVGPNGAGKSTVCLCAVGLAPAAIGGEMTGGVVIDGRPTSSTPMHERSQLAGILLQESQALRASGAATVWEEIAFGPRNLGLTLDQVVERTWAAVEHLGLTDIVDRDPNHLSGGQSQLVALASVVALAPRYLVLDEPTSQLDPVGTRLVAETLASLVRSTGVGLLIAEHRTDLLAGLCDEIAVIDGGAIVTVGPASDVLYDPRLEALGVEPPEPVRLGAAIAAAGLAVELPA